MKNLLLRLCALVLCLSMAVCLAACDDSPADPSASESASSEEQPYSLTEPVESGEVVPIPDKNLAKAMREAMNLPEEYEMTTRHCEELTYLDLRGKDIKNLDGLQYCESLEVLYASHNDIVHLDALEDLSYLFILDLSNNRIKDVTPILGLQNLMLIDLYNNPGIDKQAVYAAFDFDKTYISIEYTPVGW